METDPSWYEASKNPARLFSKVVPAGDEPVLLREIADFLDENQHFTLLSIINSGTSADPAADRVDVILLEDIG